MVARRIPKNYRVITGGVTSVKTKEGMAAFEGSLERDLYVLLDFDPDVSRFVEQPITIQYRDDRGKMRSYTPDVLIHYEKTGDKAADKAPLLAEVKFRKELKEDWGKFKPRFRAAYREAKKRGWRFKTLTEREIRTPFLMNAKFLRRFRHKEYDQARADQIWIQMKQMREADPESLVAAITDDKWEKARLISVLWQLVALGEIGVALTEPLNMRSRIWVLP